MGNHQEPVRLSSVVLFKRNVLDPAVLVSTSVIYLLCNIIISKHATSLIFLVTFGLLSWAFNHHLESYRSFKVVRKCTRALESKCDRPALREFLATHLRYIKPNFVFEHSTSPVPSASESPPAPTRTKDNPVAQQQSPVCRHVAEALAAGVKRKKRPHDTYRWINRVILFFWPYLSHVVHHQLNEFLGTSSSLARGDTGLKRLLYAFIRQIDANILAIEHCELGSNAPYIKSIHVLDEGPDATKRSLVYDLDLVYEGNMKIAFVCRYFCCCSSRLGLKDVFVKLSSRVVVGPIDSSVPTIEKIDYSLLELPKFGYKGIALVELAELKMARRSINRLIKEHLLFPKVVSLKLKDMQKMMREKEAPTSPNTGRARVESTGVERSEGDLPSRLPWTTRLAAQCMFFTCMCSNFCLRFCQEERENKHSRRVRPKRAANRIT